MSKARDHLAEAEAMLRSMLERVTKTRAQLDGKHYDVAIKATRHTLGDSYELQMVLEDAQVATESERDVQRLRDRPARTISQKTRGKR